jgi:cytochrome c553
MSHSKRIITTCLALVVLLIPTAVLAEKDNSASQKTSSKESAKKQTSAQIKSVANTGSDSVDEIKLRSGPGDPVAGKSKAELCFGCHGEDGNSIEPLIPKLAGQYGIYIAKQVRNYQASIRTHQIMSAVAASVSDADLADISAYFASQPVMKGASPSSNPIGKKLFENDDLSRMMVRCNNCHGAAGKGQNPRNPVFPVIGGQHKDYLLRQLLGFRKGDRNNSPGGVMNITVERLSDAELDALAEYVSGL